MKTACKPISISVTANDRRLTDREAKKLGIDICLDEDGKLFISSPSAHVSFVTLSFQREFSRDALIYGDEFERGYGTLQWKKDRRDILRWYFIANDSGEYFAGGVKTQPNSLCSWKITAEQIELTCDLRSGTESIRFNNRLLVAELVFAKSNGELHDFCRRFCRLMCSNPRTVKRPIFGANDWYCNYGDSSFEKIIRAAGFAVKCSEGLKFKPFVIVDDGWQKNHSSDFNGGEWDSANSRFNDIKKLATEISALGAVPGLWFRPLQSKIGLPDECFSDKNDFLLDPSHPDVLKTVADDIRRFRDWGFKVVKFDFVTADIFHKWGFEMPDNCFAETHHFYDSTKTTAQIIKTLYKTMRDAAADDMLLLGCNAIGHLAAGLVDMQRTGDDTSGNDWQRTKKMGVNTLAFRMMQHGTFFDADADCVGITENVPLEKNALWLDVLSKSSTPLFVSVAESMETDEVATLVSRGFQNSVEFRTPSVPVDWLDGLTPGKWKSDAGNDTYNWEI